MHRRMPFEPFLICREATGGYLVLSSSELSEFNIMGLRYSTRGKLLRKTIQSRCCRIQHRLRSGFLYNQVLIWCGSLLTHINANHAPKLLQLFHRISHQPAFASLPCTGEPLPHGSIVAQKLTAFRKPLYKRSFRITPRRDTGTWTIPKASA